MCPEAAFRRDTPEPFEDQAKAGTARSNQIRNRALRQRIITLLSTRAFAGDIGRVGGDLVGNHTLLDILVVR